MRTPLVPDAVRAREQYRPFMGSSLPLERPVALTNTLSTPGTPGTHTYGSSPPGVPGVKTSHVSFPLSVAGAHAQPGVLRIQRLMLVVEGENQARGA